MVAWADTPGKYGQKAFSGNQRKTNENGYLAIANIAIAVVLRSSGGVCGVRAHKRVRMRGRRGTYGCVFAHTHRYSTDTAGRYSRAAQKSRKRCHFAAVVCTSVQSTANGTVPTPSTKQSRSTILGH